MSERMKRMANAIDIGAQIGTHAHRCETCDGVLTGTPGLVVEAIFGRKTLAALCPKGQAIVRGEQPVA